MKKQSILIGIISAVSAAGITATGLAIKNFNKVEYYKMRDLYLRKIGELEVEVELATRYIEETYSTKVSNKDDIESYKNTNEWKEIANDYAYVKIKKNEAIYTLDKREELTKIIEEIDEKLKKYKDKSIYKRIRKSIEKLNNEEQ